MDVGILNLTRFESPDPVQGILGQTRLAADIRDLYGNLIDGMRADAGKLRSGGDAAPPVLAEAPPEPRSRWRCSPALSRPTRPATPTSRSTCPPSMEPCG